jgi:hypothetical protein
MVPPTEWPMKIAPSSRSSTLSEIAHIQSTSGIRFVGVRKWQRPGRADRRRAPVEVARIARSLRVQPLAKIGLIR